MASWDRRTPDQIDKQREAAVRTQVLDVVGPFSPWWRERLAALGRTPTQASTVAGLRALPAFGERDLCPDGDPAAAAALVLQATESQFALHAYGPTLRKAIMLRLTAPGSYRRLIEADTRSTSFVWAGLGVRFPVASTRSDLDVIARAGVRLWSVLGLTSQDVVVSALAGQPTAASQALHLAALASGCPAMAPGPEVSDLVGALALLPATVLVVAAQDAAALLDNLDDQGADLTSLTTLLLVGGAGEGERQAAADALARVGAGLAQVLAVHAPEGHRLLWAECRTGGAAAGLHTYPDLDLVDLVDAETGDLTGDGADGHTSGGGELVLTQLGLRGSVLLRWRTGDLVDAISTAPCPACGRTVPRVLGLQRAGLVPVLALRLADQPAPHRAAPHRADLQRADLQRADLPRADLPRADLHRVDLRGVSGALEGRTDVVDWRIVINQSARDGADELLVYVVPQPGADPAAVVVGVARDVRHGSGLLPTQVVLSAAGELPEGGTELLPRVVLRARQPV